MLKGLSLEFELDEIKITAKEWQKTFQFIGGISAMYQIESQKVFLPTSLIMPFARIMIPKIFKIQLVNKSVKTVVDETCFLSNVPSIK